MTITEIDVFRASLEMTDGAKSATVAYWTKSHSVYDFEFHAKAAIEHLQRAAAHLGFELTPIKAEAKPEAEAETCAA